MKLRPFELGLVVIFGGLLILALIMFTGGGKQSDDPGDIVVVGKVVIWGTFPNDPVNDMIDSLAKTNPSFTDVSYKYYPPSQFDDVLVNALADGFGPDLMLISHEKLAEMRRRITPIPYTSYPLRDIKDTFVDGAQIFALSDGMYGFPVAVDPLMMYWNRDILSQSGYLNAPETWEKFTGEVFPKLIKRDFSRTIQRPVVAMGEYDNVRNALSVISTLMLQEGSVGVLENGNYQVKLQLSEVGSGDPLNKAAEFYTRFSKPSSAMYSWNRSFDSDRSVFVSGNLAFYFGYGSEGPQIERLNPNLSFDIAPIPQGEAATVDRTYGKFYALTLLKTSKNKSGASTVMTALSQSTNAEKLALSAGMVPPHRSLVVAGSDGIYSRSTYKSSLYTRGWLNPDIEGTYQVFSSMIADINENRKSVPAAASDVTSRLGTMY